MIGERFTAPNLHASSLQGRLALLRKSDHSGADTVCRKRIDYPILSARIGRLMSERTRWRHMRVGLQLKSVLILGLVISGVTVAAGWFYVVNERSALRDNDLRHAARMGQALCVLAGDDLRNGQNAALERLVANLICDESVSYAALLDARGKRVAFASRAAGMSLWPELTNLPVAVSRIKQLNAETLTLAKPIVIEDDNKRKGRLVGAVRLVLDTSATGAALARAWKRITLITFSIMVLAIPLGYLLVWRIIVQPIRRLVSVTRRLAAEDFKARTNIRRRDEIGELSVAFDAMADELAASRDNLLGAKKMLEQKVVLRTRELQAANARLREEMAEQESLARTIGHDLGAPLRNIAGMVALTMMKWRDRLPGEVVARLERIQANVDQQTSMICELLDLSRIRTCPPKPQTADIGELVADVTRTFDFELKDRGITLEARGMLPVLYVEKARIRQVFQNLIDNAIKYMERPTGGRIDVSYRFADRAHRFCVTDNGPGIRHEDQREIFHIFRRAASPAALRVEGKGVGLAAVKSIAATYGGTAWVESDPAAGCSFYFTLAANRTRPPRAEDFTTNPATDVIGRHPDPQMCADKSVVLVS